MLKERVSVKWEDVEVPELLPDGWERIRHDNGLYFFYHKESGVVSWSRPYVRRWQVKDHEPPLSVFAVSLVGTKKKLEEIYANRGMQYNQGPTESDTNSSEIREDASTRLYSNEPPEPIISLDSSLEPGEIPPDSTSLEPGEITSEGIHLDLSASESEFKDSILWLVAEIVRGEKLRKLKAYEDYVNNEDPRKWRRKLRPAEVNPEGKTPVTFLQEYCFHILKKTPSYKHFIQEDSKSPFVTIVLIDGQEEAKASFANKKISKQLAALNTLDKICPGRYPHSYFTPLDQQKMINNVSRNKDLSITDERILIADGNEKTPAQVLQEYCNRAGISLQQDTSEHPDVATGNDRFTIKIYVKEWTATASGKSKKEAKQRAAQFILGQMHPDLRTWGQLLQYYEEEKELHKGKGPNLTLLKKLKEEMLKRYPFETDYEPFEPALLDIDHSKKRKLESSDEDIHKTKKHKHIH